MDNRISQKLAEPAFEFAEQDKWRSVLADNLKQFGSLQAALYGGLQSATPGMAFLHGYQCAIRCLDADCPAETLAAFAVSESGVKNPKDLATALTQEKQGWQLDGQKSHVMLLPDLLDDLYLVVKQEGRLVGVKTSTNTQGITVTKQLQAPFVSDIPHAAISLQQVCLTDEALLAEDGHAQWNKPFRYWEDMHVAAAMLGWMYRQAGQNGELLTYWQQLEQAFSESPEYYAEQSFDLLDSVSAALDVAAEELDQACLAMWKRDRMLLVMGSNIRSRVKARVMGGK